MSELLTHFDDSGLYNEHAKQEFSAWTLERLNQDSISKLVADLLPADDERQGRQFGVHIIDGSSKYADIGRFVELNVFDKFFGNDIDVMRQEYEQFDRQSVFLTVLDYEEKAPAGVIRLIRPSEKGLKSLNDLTNPEGPWASDNHSIESRLGEMGDPTGENTIDIGTMAVMPKYRSAHARVGVSASLYSTCVRWSLKEGFNHWITIVDKRIYKMMQQWGEPFESFEDCDWASYLDSNSSLPVYTELNSGLQRIKQFDVETENSTGVNPNIYDLYTKGQGLQNDFVLPSIDSVE